MWPDILELIWRVADCRSPTFTEDDLADFPEGARSQLMDLGVLRESTTATHVVCDACAEGHVRWVDAIRYPDDTTRFYVVCPENGRVEVDRHRLLQWTVCFEPLLDAVASELATVGESNEVVPDRVWSLGRASLAGRSKPVWCVRGLGWPDAPRIAGTLPNGRSPVLLVLGRMAPDGLIDMPREAIFETSTVVGWSDGFTVDRDAIESQLADIEPAPKAKPRRKRGRRDEVVGALKRELRQQIHSRNRALCHADETGEAYHLPPLTQKDLASLIGTSPSSVSRAINKSGDRELTILFQAVQDEASIRLC